MEACFSSLVLIFDGCRKIWVLFLQILPELPSELSHPKFADMPWVTPQRSSLWWLRVEKHHPEVASENLDKSGQCESVRYPSVGNMLGSIRNSFHKLLGPPSQGRIPTGALDAAKVKSYPAARLWRFLTKPGLRPRWGLVVMPSRLTPQHMEVLDYPMGPEGYARS